MTRTTMFSTVFPAYHPRKGEPTYFVEKIISGLVRNDIPGYGTETIKHLRDIGVLDVHQALIVDPKHHTIRAGHRYQPGDYMVMKIWSGKPYRSKQITLGPPVLIQKVWDIQLEFVNYIEDGYEHIFISSIGDENLISAEQEKQIAANDGLTHQDWLDWFHKPFDGQIICWNKDINY